MWRYIVNILQCLAITGFLSLMVGCGEPEITTTTEKPMENTGIKLPEPQYDSDVSIEQSLLQRRSIREYSDEPLA